MSKKTHHYKPASLPPPLQRAVPKHRQCRLCFNGRGGVGVHKWHNRKGNATRTCYRCNQCGFEWTVQVRRITESIVIEWQEVDCEYTDIDLETR